jgi:hypothetical protein
MGFRSQRMRLGVEAQGRARVRGKRSSTDRIWTFTLKEIDIPTGIAISSDVTVGSK